MSGTIFGIFIILSIMGFTINEFYLNRDAIGVSNLQDLSDYIDTYGEGGNFFSVIWNGVGTTAQIVREVLELMYGLATWDYNFLTEAGRLGNGMRIIFGSVTTGSSLLTIIRTFRG